MPEQKTWVIGIYVYQDATIAFANDKELAFRAFPGDELSVPTVSTDGAATVKLARGIYRIDPQKVAPVKMEPQAGAAELITAVGKDPPPDPTASVALKAGFEEWTKEDYESLKNFFPSIERGA